MKKILSTLAICVAAMSSQGQAFFTQTTYRGAFGQGAGANWMTGWTNFNPKATLYPGDPGGPAATLVSVPANTVLSGTTNWTAGNYYVLQGPVIVPTGATLNIAAGTVIRGAVTTFPAEPAYLVASQGGKINALGTASNPVIMTSNASPAARLAGDWGGLLICGRAPVNLNKSPDIGGRRFEGTPTRPETFYGGTLGVAGSGVATDNSGIYQYLRVEFAGDASITDRELNGIMLAGVGSGTTFDHVQVSFANDDSFEWFGGTVNGKYLVAFAGADDDFDVDEGFNGRVQFGLALRHPSFFDATGAQASNGFEMDNNTIASGAATSNLSQYSPSPATSTTFSNMTMIGPLRAGEANSAVSDRFGWGLNFRTNPATGVFNSIVIGYARLFRSQVSVQSGLTSGPGNNSKFCADSATVKNSFLGQDVANTIALTTTGGYQSATACTPNPTSAATYLSLLTDGTRNSVVTGASTLSPAFLGITSPYYTGTGGLTFGNFAAADFSGINPTLVAGSPFLSGASFVDPRLANFLSAGDLVINSAQTPAVGAYGTVTVTPTGVANLTSNLNVSGNLVVQAGGVVNMGQFALVGPGGAIIVDGATIRTASPGGISNQSNGAFQNLGNNVVGPEVNYVFNASTIQSTGNLLSSARNIEVANASGVTVNAPLAVNGILDLTAGTLTSGGNLTIGSSPVRQGIIDDFSAGNTGTISGTIKFRRYTTGLYRHIAAPLAGASVDAFTSVGIACSGIREFEELSNSWILIADPCAGAPLPQMSSVAVLAAGPITFQISGTLSTGTKTASIFRAGTSPGILRGWNALGNPYPSPIRWSLVSGIAGNSAASALTAYVWNASTNNYGIITSTGTATGGANDVIAPGQGFLVRKSTVGAPSTFTLNNSVRVSQSQPATFIRQGVADGELLRLNFATEGGADEILVTTNGEEATKLFTDVKAAPSLYVRGAEPMAIATITDLTSATRLPLGIQGQGMITVSNLNTPAGLSAYALNLRTGRSTALTAGSTLGAGSQDRYEIVFRQGSSEASNSLYAYSAGRTIEVVLDGNANGSVVEVVDAAGKLVSTSKVEAGRLHTAVAAPAAAGVYQVRVSGSCQGVTRVATGL